MLFSFVITRLTDFLSRLLFLLSCVFVLCFSFDSPAEFSFSLSHTGTRSLAFISFIFPLTCFYSISTITSTFVLSLSLSFAGLGGIQKSWAFIFKAVQLCLSLSHTHTHNERDSSAHTLWPPLLSGHNPQSASTQTHQNTQWKYYSLLSSFRSLVRLRFTSGAAASLSLSLKDSMSFFVILYFISIKMVCLYWQNCISLTSLFWQYSFQNYFIILSFALLLSQLCVYFVSYFDNI